MDKSIRIASAALMAAVISGSAGWAAAHNHDHDHDHDHDEDHHVAIQGDIQVVHAFMAAVPPTDPGVVFFELVNGGTGDRLLAGHVLGAENVEIVGFTMRDGAAFWQPVGPMAIPSGKTDFDPGGMAVMVTGLPARFEEGDQFDLVLTFEIAGEFSVPVEVMSAGTTEHPHAGHAH